MAIVPPALDCPAAGAPGRPLRHGDGALLGGDDAFIAHVRPVETDVIHANNAAAVLHVAGETGEIHATREKVRIGNVPGGSDESTPAAIQRILESSWFRSNRCGRSHSY